MTSENTSELFKELEDQVERMDKEIYDLNSKVELLESILMKIVGGQTISSDLLFDIDYISLKKDLSGEERNEISFLLLQTQQEYMQKGIVPNLEEFHSKLLEALVINPKEKESYPIQISIQLLEKHIQLGAFSVGTEILDNR